MSKLYIFDLDGTLADISHRVHFIEDKPNGEDWDGFYKACIDDTPIADTVAVMEALYLAGNDVVIWSGRSDTVRAETIEWVNKNTVLGARHVDNILKMRKDGDYRPDHIIKREWLDELTAFDIARIGGVFEDRDRVVKMWRTLGFTCYHVAEGNF